MRNISIKPLGLTILFALSACGANLAQNGDAPAVNTSGENPSQHMAGRCFFGDHFIDDGVSVQAFKNATVPVGSQCESEQRVCDAGTLSGSFNANSCAVLAAQSCTFNGQTIASGRSVQAYQSATVPFGSTCQAQTRICTNGTLSGTFGTSTCTVNAASSCSFGTHTVANGASVQAYQSATVPFGSTCQTQTRVCTNGTLAGSFTFDACTVGVANSCTFNGQTIADGGTVQAFQNATVPYGSLCQGQARVCTNGSLSGSFGAPTCTVSPGAACTFDGQTVPNNSTVFAYQATTVQFPVKCVTEARLCTNGTLSGSLPASTCTVVPAPADCTFNGQTIANGSQVVGYLQAYGEPATGCPSRTKTCNNGTLSEPDYALAACSVRLPELASFQTVDKIDGLLGFRDAISGSNISGASLAATIFENSSLGGDCISKVIGAQYSGTPVAVFYTPGHSENATYNGQLVTGGEVSFCGTPLVSHFKGIESVVITADQAVVTSTPDIAPGTEIRYSITFDTHHANANFCLQRLQSSQTLATGATITFIPGQTVNNPYVNTSPYVTKLAHFVDCTFEDGVAPQSRRLTIEAPFTGSEYHPLGHVAIYGKCQYDAQDNTRNNITVNQTLTDTNSGTRPNGSTGPYQQFLIGNATCGPDNLWSYSAGIGGYNIGPGLISATYTVGGTGSFTPSIGYQVVP